jgi:hypothetical protein
MVYPGTIITKNRSVFPIFPATAYLHTNRVRIITDSILIYKSKVVLMELAESLKEFVEEGQDWERKNTSVKGVSIIRLPQFKNRAASLAIDINPIGENGLPMKKKGIMIMNAAELQAFREAFRNEKLDNLMNVLEEVTGRKTAGKPAKGDVVQL